MRDFRKGWGGILLLFLLATPAAASPVDAVDAVGITVADMLLFEPLRRPTP